MLQLAGKIDKYLDIEPWNDKFEEFDLDHDGVLTMKDVNAYELIVKRVDLGKMSHKRLNMRQGMLGKVTSEAVSLFLETIRLGGSAPLAESAEDAEGVADIENPAGIQMKPKKRRMSLGHINNVLIGIGLTASTGVTARDLEDPENDDMVVQPLRHIHRKLSMTGATPVSVNIKQQAVRNMSIANAAGLDRASKFSSGKRFSSFEASLDRSRTRSTDMRSISNSSGGGSGTNVPFAAGGTPPESPVSSPSSSVRMTDGSISPSQPPPPPSHESPRSVRNQGGLHSLQSWTQMVADQREEEVVRKTSSHSLVNGHSPVHSSPPSAHHHHESGSSASPVSMLFGVPGVTIVESNYEGSSDEEEETSSPMHCHIKTVKSNKDEDARKKKENDLSKV
eukprot:gene29133-36126_t